MEPTFYILEEGTEDNFVMENGRYPPGTNAKDQVCDEGTNNRVIGHRANGVLSPGIGQRLQLVKQKLSEVEDGLEAPDLSWEIPPPE